MTRWTDEEKAAIGSLRGVWDRCEEATKSCPWMEQYDKSEILEALKICRYHINSGNTNPRPLELYHNMVKMEPNKNYNIERLLQEIEGETPSSMETKRSIMPLLLDLLGKHLITNWRPQRPIDGEYPNYLLPEFHPDKTDQHGLPYWMPTDEDGMPREGYTPRDLSHKRNVLRLRKMHGLFSPQRREFTNQGTRPWVRIPLPEVTEYQKYEHEQQLKRLETQAEAPLYIEKRRKWYKDVYVKEQLDSMKQGLEQRQERLKEAYKRGEILKESAQLDIDDKLKKKREQLELPLKDKGDNLAHIDGQYRAWLTTQEKK